MLQKAAAKSWVWGFICGNDKKESKDELSIHQFVNKMVLSQDLISATSILVDLYNLVVRNLLWTLGLVHLEFMQVKIEPCFTDKVN